MADNGDRLKARTDADFKLPVATSGKSASEEMQLQNEELVNQLETSQDKREQLRNFLNDLIDVLEAARNALIEINEEYGNEADKEANNETIPAAIQQDNEFEQLKKSHDQLKEANLQLLQQLHSAEIKEYKAQKLKLKAIIKCLRKKLLVQAESLKAEQENLIKETQRGEVLRSEFEGERERYQAEIDELKTALEHRDKEDEPDELRKIRLPRKTEEEVKPNSQAAANSPPSGSSRKRKAPKIDYINIQSDFESDDDEAPLKVHFSKR